MSKTTTPTLPDAEAEVDVVVKEVGLDEAVAAEAEVADDQQASLAHVPTRTNN